MGMMQYLRNMFGGSVRHAAQQQVMINLVDMLQANRPLAEVWDIRRFADDGYRRNSLIFACVGIKATTFSQPELLANMLDQSGEYAELPPGHMLNQLLGRGMMASYVKQGAQQKGSQTAFMRAWSMQLDIAGNAYAYIERNKQGMPLKLRLLPRPDLVKPVPDSSGAIYEYAYGNQPNIQHIPAMDIVHEMAGPDPLDPYRGLSPIAVLARMGDLDNFAADYLRAFFLNAGIPSGMLKFKMEVPKEERERVQARWREQYGYRANPRVGGGGWFDVGVIDADVEYQEIGSKLRTMDLEQVFGQTESRICGAFGVHPILVASWIGLMRSTMANYEQARRSLYTDTMLPIWTSTADRLTTDLAAEFSDDIVLRFNSDEVPELQRDRTQQKELALKAWDSGLITRAEARSEWGYEEGADDDVYKQGPADMYVPAGVALPAAEEIEGEEEQQAVVPFRRAN